MTHLNYQEQLNILVKKGLVITNEDYALNLIKNIGYFRLSSYLYPFRTTSSKKNDEKYSRGITIETIGELVTFDSKLRKELLAGLEIFELSFRAVLSYITGISNTFIQYRTDFLHPNLSDIKYNKWKKNYDRDMAYASKFEYIKNFSNAHDKQLPIWMAVEYMQFGTLTFLYDILTDQHKTEISSYYNISSRKLMNNSIESFRDIRNICAHHSRLWNSRSISLIPKVKKDPLMKEELLHLDYVDLNKIYRSLVFLIYIVEKIDPDTHFKTKMRNLICSFPNSINHLVFSEMGFPVNWIELDFWQE